MIFWHIFSCELTEKYLHLNRACLSSEKSYLHLKNTRIYTICHWIGLRASDAGPHNRACHTAMLANHWCVGKVRQLLWPRRIFNPFITPAIQRIALNTWPTLYVYIWLELSQGHESNPIFPSRAPDKYLSAPMTGSFDGDYQSYLSAFETNTYIYMIYIS